MDNLKKFLSILVIIVFSVNSEAKKLALTFDDLPANRHVSVQVLETLTDKILTGLKNHRASAIGFVNEKSLYDNNTDSRTNILNKWILNGNILGNHTFSHISQHRVKNDFFKSEILKGQKITKKLLERAGLTEHYFRHPYLHTGLSEKSRKSIANFLSANGYTTAPVTFDTDDWQFDRLYVQALENNDLNAAERIASQYIEHTKNKFSFYDRATLKIFGRNISQIWLLHANSINADNIDKLLKIAEQSGYSFISLSDSLKDSAYKTKDVYYKDFGLSWLYRWDYSNGLKVNWKDEPEPDLPI